MKRLLFILGAAGRALALAAQTNPTTPATSPETADIAAAATAQTNTLADEAAETVITSDTANVHYNKTNTVVTYRGNVRVENPQLTLTCALLTTHLTQSNKVDTIIAETNVIVDGVLKGKPVHATCAHALYHFQVQNSVTNQTLLLNGDPVIQTSDGSSAGDSILVNLVTGDVDVVNPKTHLLLPRDMKGQAKPATTEPAAAAEPAESKTTP